MTLEVSRIPTNTRGVRPFAGMPAYLIMTTLSNGASTWMREISSSRRLPLLSQPDVVETSFPLAELDVRVLDIFLTVVADVSFDLY